MNTHASIKLPRPAKQTKLYRVHFPAHTGSTQRLHPRTGKLLWKMLLILAFQTGAIQGHTQVKTPSQNTCGCDYLPLCNYTAKRTFGGTTYYGIDGSEKNGRYYRCENSKVTLLWIELVDVPAGTGSDYDPFTNTHTTIHYYDTEERYYTEQVLDYSLPIGAKWKVPNSPWEYVVISKSKSLTVKDKQYNDVIQLRCTSGETMTFSNYVKELYAKGSDNLYYEGRAITRAEDKYWAKGYGFLKSENTMDTVKKELVAKITSGKIPQATPEQIRQHLLANFSGVYANHTKKALIALPNGTPVRYLGIKQSGNVVFIDGIAKASPQLEAYTNACDGTIEFTGTMYDYKVTIKNCEGASAGLNENTKSFRFSNVSYNYLDESITLTFPGTAATSYQKPTIIFPGQFSHKAFLNYNAGNDNRTTPTSSLNPTQIADKVRTLHKAQEERLSSAGTIEPAFIGTWMNVESIGSKPDLYYDVYRFFDDGTFEQILFSDGRPDRPVTHIVRDKGMWRIMNKKLVLLGTLESELRRYSQEQFLKQIKTVDEITVNTSQWDYTIRVDRRNQKDLLSFGSRYGSQKEKKKEYEKTTESAYKILQSKWNKLQKLKTPD
jgi:hypothetical protein